MGIIAANTDLFVIDIPCRFGWTRGQIVETNAFMNKGRNRLNHCPAGFDGAELCPRQLRQAIGFAISAAEKEKQHFVGELLERQLASVRHDQIRFERIFDYETARDRNATFRYREPRADVSEAVDIIVEWHVRLREDPLR